MSDAQQAKDESRRQGRDAYDWIVLFVAVLALFAAGAAAWFTWEQAAVAREQTRRSLRAYAVVTAELTAEDGTGRPYVKLSTENMGQTPVYDIAYFAQAAVVNRDREALPNAGFMRVRCDALAEKDWEAFTDTFSKSNTQTLDLPDGFERMESLRPVLRAGQRVYAYGTACYRDIFGEAHAFRFCNYWVNPDYKAIRCSVRE